MRNRDADDGDVENLQDRREHDGDDERDRRLRLDVQRLRRERELRADPRQLWVDGGWNGLP